MVLTRDLAGTASKRAGWLVGAALLLTGLVPAATALDHQCGTYWADDGPDAFCDHERYDGPTPNCEVWIPHSPLFFRCLNACAEDPCPGEPSDGAFLSEMSS